MVADVAEFTALRMVEARQLTPHMRRITFAGTNLHAFATDEQLHVGLLLPPPGSSRDDWLTVRRDGKASMRDTGSKPINRKYTIRTIDPSIGQLEIDFVLHDDGGPGGTWAAQATAGDLVGVLGPGGRGLVPADWYCIAGDETALPAIGRLMDAMPDNVHGHVIVEIADAREEQLLRIPSGMTLRWLHRNDAPAGTTELLLDAIKAVRIPLDSGRPFIWVGAEFGAAQAIRGYLCESTGISKTDQLVVAYWRYDQSDLAQQKRLMTGEDRQLA